MMFWNSRKSLVYATIAPMNIMIMKRRKTAADRQTASEYIKRAAILLILLFSSPHLLFLPSLVPCFCCTTIDLTSLLHLLQTGDNNNNITILHLAPVHQCHRLTIIAIVYFARISLQSFHWAIVAAPVLLQFTPFIHIITLSLFLFFHHPPPPHHHHPSGGDDDSLCLLSPSLSLCPMHPRPSPVASIHPSSEPCQPASQSVICWVNCIALQWDVYR